MKKFTYAEATVILRAAEELTPDENSAIDRVLMHIRERETKFKTLYGSIDHRDFDDMIDFYSWFYRYFVGE